MPALVLFTAPRVDYLHRLRHYTATSPSHFQNFVLFTNYQFYIDEFVRYGHELMRRAPDPANPQDDDDCIAFVEPGNVITRRVGQSVEPGDAWGRCHPLAANACISLAAQGPQRHHHGQHWGGAGQRQNHY